MKTGINVCSYQNPDTKDLKLREWERSKPPLLREQVVGSSQRNEYAEVLMSNIQNEDFQAMKQMFSKYISENNDLDQQIKSLKNYIDGHIESYDAPFVIVGERNTDSKGTVYRGVQGVIQHIKTDTGFEYNISYSEIISARDDSYIGLEELIITTVKNGDLVDPLDVGGFIKN